MAPLTLTGSQNIANFLSQVPGAQMNFTSGLSGALSDPTLYNLLLKQEQDKQLAQQQAQQSGPGGLLGLGQGIIEGIADPFLRLGKVGIVGLNDLMGQGGEARRIQNEFFGQDSNLLEEALKGGAGAASWFVPGLGAAGTLGNVLTRGALAGGLGSLSRQNFLTKGVDLGELATGAGLGGLASGAMYGVGKLAGKLFQPSNAMQQPAIGAEQISPLKMIDQKIAQTGQGLDTTAWQQATGATGDQVAGMQLGQNVNNARINALQSMVRLLLLLPVPDYHIGFSKHQCCIVMLLLLSDLPLLIVLHSLDLLNSVILVPNSEIVILPNLGSGC